MSATQVVKGALALIQEHGFVRAGMIPSQGLGVAAALSLVGGSDFDVIGAADRIRRANGIEHLVDWELVPGRTQAEVVTALKRASR